MNVKMSLFLILQNFKFAFECLDIIFLGLNTLVIVNAIELPFGNEDLILYLLYFYLLFLYFQSFLSD
jgi:uncharacterized RDD family membrane protein YckC